MLPPPRSCINRKNLSTSLFLSFTALTSHCFLHSFLVTSLSTWPSKAASFLLTESRDCVQTSSQVALASRPVTSLTSSSCITSRVASDESDSSAGFSAMVAKGAKALRPATAAAAGCSSAASPSPVTAAFSVHGISSCSLNMSSPIVLGNASLASNSASDDASPLACGARSSSATSDVPTCGASKSSATRGEFTGGAGSSSVIWGESACGAGNSSATCGEPSCGASNPAATRGEPSSTTANPLGVSDGGAKESSSSSSSSSCSSCSSCDPRPRGVSEGSSKSSSSKIIDGRPAR
mmetsp:Transcript_76511/g.211327  ORF Transcript_76511/g.211327 Transcript_76511/m.211327 type:complete len:294 (+) Transcript_76511:654-1535(+)